MTDTTRESVERWEVTHNASGLGFSDGIRQSPHGNFVALADYTALLTRAEAAEVERDALQAKLALAVEALEWQERHRLDAIARAKHIRAVEDAAVLDLCKRHGFGAVIDSAARQWASIGPGSSAAFFVGGSIGDTTAQKALATLTADTLPDPRIEGWNAAIEAAHVTIGGMPIPIGATKYAWQAQDAIRAIPCPYTPKEGKDDATD